MKMSHVIECELEMVTDFWLHLFHLGYTMLIKSMLIQTSGVFYGEEMNGKDESFLSKAHAYAT